MERTVTGRISFEVAIRVDCMKNEYEDEILDRIYEEYDNMNNEFALRKLLNDNMIQIVFKEVGFDEVE